MASGRTNRGRYLELSYVYRGATPPTNFYVALCTSAVTPTVDINTLGELTEIAAGNGYTTGGYQLARNSTDFDVLTEDDSGDLAKVQVKDVTWTASGGSLPASGNGARWAVLTSDEATVANRQVFAWHDLVSDRSVSVGQPLTLQDLELRTTAA